jgi:hypothetical protein
MDAATITTTSQAHRDALKAERKRMLDICAFPEFRGDIGFANIPWLSFSGSDMRFVKTNSTANAQWVTDNARFVDVMIHTMNQYVFSARDYDASSAKLLAQFNGTQDVTYVAMLDSDTGNGIALVQPYSLDRQLKHGLVPAFKRTDASDSFVYMLDEHCTKPITDNVQDCRIHLFCYLFCINQFGKGGPLEQR